MSVFRRLLFPTLILFVIAGFAWFNLDVMLQFGQGALDRQKRILLYGLQIGLFVSAAFFVDRLIRVFIWDGLIRGALGGPVPRLLKNGSSVVLASLCVMGIVGVVFGQSVTGIWATSGILGLVLGLALQSIILDVFCGLAINVDRAFRIGDWIQIHNRNIREDFIAEIIEVSWRTTRLLTKENNTLIIPNSILGSSLVMNFSSPNPEARFELDFCLDFSVPTDRALRVLLGGVKAVLGGGILADPKPSVRLKAATPIGVVYQARYWIRANEISPSKARNKVLTSALEHLGQAGLTLAYPKEDVFYEKMPARQLDSHSLGDRIVLLQRVSLFRDLAESEVRHLAETMTRRLFREGETVIRRGEAGNSMFILVEGLLDVYIDKGSGEEIRVANIPPGRFLGEMSLLTGEPRSATLRAATDAVLYEINRAELTSLIEGRKEVLEALSLAVAEYRLRDDKSRTAMTAEDKEKQTLSVAGQIMAKMRVFFRGVVGGGDVPG